MPLHLWESMESSFSIFLLLSPSLPFSEGVASGGWGRGVGSEKKGGEEEKVRGYEHVVVLRIALFTGYPTHMHMCKFDCFLLILPCPGKVRGEGGEKRGVYTKTRGEERWRES